MYTRRRVATIEQPIPSLEVISENHDPNVSLAMEIHHQFLTPNATLMETTISSTIGHSKTQLDHSPQSLDSSNLNN
jgi:hypothetical protein